MATRVGSSKRLITKNLIFAIDGNDSATFPGNGSSSTTYGDLIGQNDGTLVNKAGHRYHKQGILSYTGNTSTADYVTIPGSVASAISGGSFTIGIWVRLNNATNSGGMSNGTMPIIAFNNGTSARTCLSISRTGTGGTENERERLGMFFFGDDLVANTTQVTTIMGTKWTYVVGTFDSSSNTQTLYINGSQHSTRTSSGATNIGSTTGNIGRNDIYTRLGNSESDNPKLDGQTGPVHIYDRTLSAAEVLENYNVWKLRFQPSEGSVTTDNSVIHVDPDNSTSYGGSGTTWTDLSGNSNNGTISGATFISSTTGSAFDFDGSNDDVEFANWDNLVTSAMTYTCWFKTTNTDAYYLMAGRSGADNSHLTFAINRDNTNQSTGRITAYIRSTGGSLNKIIHTSNSGITDGQWHCIHLACTNNSQQLYLDGALLESGTNSWGTSNADSLPFTVGALRSGDYHFNGKIGHVHVRNVALTAAQVKSDYNTLVPRYIPGYDTGKTDAEANIVTSNLVAHYDMGSPVCNPGSGTTITDLGGSNNGTISGATYSKINGGVLDFDGSNDDFEVADSTDLRITSTITLQGWIYLDAKSGNYQHIAIKQSGASSTAYGLWIKDSGELYAEINASSNSVTGATSLATGTWLNVALTYGGNSIKLYLNGSLDASSSPGSITISHGSYPFDLFSGPFNDRIDGKLGSMLLYSSGLSAAQILSNYNATKSRFGL